MANISQTTLLSAFHKRKAFKKPLKTMGHIFYATLSFEHHFITIWKHQIRVKIGNFFVPLDFEIWRMTLKKIRHLFQPTSIFVHHFLAICELSYGPETPNSGQNRQFVVPCDVEIWRMTLQNNKAPLIFHIKLCRSFHWPMWIQTGVTVRKWLNWFLTSVTLTFDRWPWPFAWISRLSNGNKSWKFQEDTVKGT